MGWRLSFPCRSGSELFLFDCTVANMFDKDREKGGTGILLSCGYQVQFLKRE